MHTEKINVLRHHANEGHQARCDDPAHILDVLLDKEEEVVPACVALPAPSSASEADPPTALGNQSLSGASGDPTVSLLTDTTNNESSSVPRASLLTSNINWANLMAAMLTDPNFQANFVSNTTLAPVIDYQNLTLVFTDETALKNSLVVEMDVLPDVVVHMMQNCVFIPLWLLTTAALDHIQLIKNVKFWCITFGNGTGHTSIDENTFPTEDSLSESDFWQAYKNWLALVKLLSGPAVVDGWHSHHGKMI